jgi:hypothetical protein
MSDDTDRLLGEVIGELRAVSRSFSEYQVAHNQRHEELDKKIESHAATINQAKGAKTMLLLGAAAISGAVSAVIHFFK